MIYTVYPLTMAATMVTGIRDMRARARDAS